MRLGGVIIMGFSIEQSIHDIKSTSCVSDVPPVPPVPPHMYIAQVKQAGLEFQDPHYNNLCNNSKLCPLCRKKAPFSKMVPSFSTLFSLSVILVHSQVSCTLANKSLNEYG